MTLKKLFKDKLDICVLVAVVAVFGYFFLFHDVVECGDSFQYEKQLPMREPVYSLMLQLFQVTVGDGYMKAVGLLQNLLAIVCTYWTYRRVRDIFDFGIVFSIGSIGVLMAPHLLTPLASKTHLILTNNIMTEGITIPLYYIWFTMLLGLIWRYYDRSRQIKAVVVNLCLGVVLAMTRGQMVLCLAIWWLVVCFITIRDKGTLKRTALVTGVATVAVLVAVVCKGQLTKWYNLAETGYYVNTVSSKPMMLANLVYVCDENDADYISNEDVREAFRDVVKLAHEEELTIDYAPDGIIAKGRFHESGHELLNFDYIDPAMRPVIESRYGITESEFVNLIIHEDLLCGEIIKELLPKVFGKYFDNYVIIATLGFVRSVSVEKSVGPIFALFIYLVAVVLTVWGLKKEESRNSSFTMMLVLVVICGTVLGTSLMIQCITRYMIYNLPFFYIAGMSLCKSLFAGAD